MSDPNIFAILIANDDKSLASSAFRLQHNEHGYDPTSEDASPGIAAEPIINSRQSTPAGGTRPLDRILLRFNDPPKDQGQGWQFGTNPKLCDFLLGHRGTGGISSRQFRITINQRFRVVLHDDGSRFGTYVAHGDQGQGMFIKNDRRVLCLEPSVDEYMGEVVVSAPSVAYLNFAIEFPNHTSPTPEYWKNLDAFVKASGQALPQFNVLGFDSNPSTGPLSRGPQTPRETPPYLNCAQIGSGEFGTVYRVVDSREGDIYASKTFHKPSQRGPVERNKWLAIIRKEYNIMKESTHPNIVKVQGFQEVPEPAIIMEYCPLGSLEDLKCIEPEEHVSVFRQVLGGLSHLHQNGIAHRDLKPANLLVAQRPPIVIKISDFGFAKALAEDGFLKTFCGTPLYAAPEIHPNGSDYLPSVDIWSAGVMTLQAIYGLPNHQDPKKFPEHAWFKLWPAALVARVDDLDEDEDQVIDIIKQMVTIQPEDRLSADECLQKGCDNGLFRRHIDGSVIDTGTVSSDDDASNGTATPTQQSHAGTKDRRPKVSRSDRGPKRRLSINSDQAKPPRAKQSHPSFTATDHGGLDLVPATSERISARTRTRGKKAKHATRPPGSSEIASM